jgi:alcohol dehydrogenase class IV
MSSIPLASAVPTLGLLRLPRTILFGAGQRRAIGQAVAPLGRSVLVCTDARLGADPVLGEIVASLEEAGCAVRVFAETEPELPVAAITACVAGLRGVALDVVVGLGGGSCLDMAKVVSLLLSHGGSPRDYYGEFMVPGPSLPVVAVPTTAGTGSEVTPVAVLTDPDRLMKVGISSPHLIPQVAICDPELTYSCPAGLTAVTGADALTHLVEAFTAIRRPPAAELAAQRVFIGKSTFTDSVALAGLRLLGQGLLRAHRQPDDAASRADTMMGALAGGIALGTAGTAAAHALQYPLGAITHTSHGIGVGALIPYVMRHNFPARVREFARIAETLGVVSADSDGSGGSFGVGEPVAAARAGVEAVDAIIDGLGIPATLADLGLPGDRLDEVAEQALTARRLVENNPRPLDHAAMSAIVRAAYEGDRSFPEASPEARPDERPEGPEDYAAAEMRPH